MLNEEKLKLEIYIFNMLYKNTKLSSEVIEIICKKLNIRNMPENYIIKLRYKLVKNNPILKMAINLYEIITDSTDTINDFTKKHTTRDNYINESNTPLLKKYKNSEDYKIVFAKNTVEYIIHNYPQGWHTDYNIGHINAIQITISKDIFSEHFVDDTSLIDYVFSLLEVNYSIYDKNNNEKHLYDIKKQLIENGLDINKPDGIYSVIIDDCNTYLTYRIALCYLICPKKTINIV